MKPIHLFSLFVISICMITLQIGCEEQLAAPSNLDSAFFNSFSRPTPTVNQTYQPAITEPVIQRSPKITFQKVLHDFGNISPLTDHICTFNFTNTGNDVLVISEVENACSCTINQLTKVEYAPGEGGILKVGYVSGTQLGNITRELIVYSNDPANPEVTLSVKSNIISHVDYEPKNLELKLFSENGDCPVITIVSLDNRPFSITSFESTGDCVTVDFNPSVQATKFVLRPKINMVKLEKELNGLFEIGLSHPQCKQVSGTFDAPPRFSSSPRTISIGQMNPGESVIRKLIIKSNYNEEFNIDTLLPSTGNLNVRDIKRTAKGYELELEISPPQRNSNMNVFSDTFSLKIQGAERIDIPIMGSYAGARTSTNSSTRKSSSDKECKTCKPIIF